MSCKWQLTISSRHEVLTYMYDMPIWKTKEILFWKSTDQQKNDVNSIGNNQMKSLPGSQRHFFILCKVFFFSPFPQQGRSQLFIYSSATGWKDWSIYITSYHMRNMNFWKIDWVLELSTWLMCQNLFYLLLLAFFNDFL